MAQQGRYTYQLDVENARALKKLADFAKASDKATQRIEKDIQSQKRANSSLGKELLALKRKYAEAQKQAKSFGGTARTFNKGHVESLRNLKKQIGNVREEYAKGRRELVKYNIEQRKTAAPPPATRGFRGTTGRRAGFGRGMAQRFGSTGLGGSMAGGAAAAAGGLAVGAAVVALAAATKGLIAYGNQAAIAAAKQAKFQRALVGVLGDDTRQGLEVINEVVKKYNLPIQEATENFTRLAASTRSAGVSTADAKRVFEGMIVANKALGGSNEQLNGILLATQQVFSKGKVTAEELRGQIGERLPGAVSLFATSMGITTAELDKRLEQGTVSVEDFVNFSKELFTEFGASAEAISKGPEEAGARLQTALNELQLNVGKLLGPVGAMFQNVFTEIIKLVNQATLALMRFYNIGLDNQLNSAIQARVRAQAQLARMDAAGVDSLELGGAMGQSNRLTRAQAEANVASTTKAAAELQKRFNKSLGVGESGMKVGDLVTSEDFMNNRSGKGDADRANNARANAIRKLAQVQAQEVKKLGELERKIIKENNNLILNLQEQMQTGETAAQLAIVNTLLRADNAVAARQQAFLADVTQAEANLLAAQNRLAAAKPGADAIRAQGAVDVAQAKLTGAQARATTFGQNAETLQGANAMAAGLASTAPFRQATETMKGEVELLRTRNRLVMEGFSGPALEGAMRKAELDQVATDKLTAFNLAREQGNLTEERHAQLVRQTTEANQSAKIAVDELTAAQRSNGGALAEYITSANEYINNIQARMADIASTIEQGIATAITGLVNGTMTAGEAFQNFFKSIGEAFLKVAAQMIAKLIVINLLKAAFSAFGGGGNFLSGMFGGGGGGFDVGSTALGAGAGNVGGIGTFGPNFGIPQYAKGGIVTKPTTALIGEGGMNEAVVPLPDGKSIPIAMGKNGMGNSVNTNITVNVAQGGETSSQVSGDNAGRLSKAIDSAVKRVIMDERRVGGLLYNG